MKKIIFILFALVFSTSLIISQDSKKEPKVEFTKTSHDFGKVAESTKTATCEFTFKNVGTAPLLIQRVGVSCGCTTPEYTSEPVLPGKEGKIKVSYSTVGRPGVFSKDVNVFTNVADTVYRLTIKGEVIRDRK